LSARSLAERAGHDPHPLTLLRIRARPVRLEAGRWHALGAAQQPLERKPAPHRGLSSDRCGRGPGPYARPVPLRAQGARPGATRRLSRRTAREVAARVSAAGLSGGTLVRPLAGGLEVRGARLSLLPA